MFSAKKLIPLAVLSSLCAAASAEGLAARALSAISETTPAGLVDDSEREPGATGWFKSVGRGFGRLVDRGDTHLVLPLYTEHPRWDYSNRSQENAYPFGGGFARSMIDSRGNERLAYAIVFSDSHYKPEPFLGYAWLSRWNVGQTGLHVGAGYLAGLTFRADYMWLPIPAPLPLVNVGTKNVGAYMTYIPFSNVFFVFSTIAIDSRSSREMPLTPKSVWFNRSNLVYGGASWVHNDLGSPDGMTMSSDAGWNAGVRHYFDRHWAADLGVIRSRHNTYWYGDKRHKWNMTQVNLFGQYHADATDALRVFAGLGLGYASLHRDGLTKNSVHPAMQVGFTWAFSREFHLTGNMTTAFPRFHHIDDEVTTGKATARPAPTSFNLSLGKTF